MLIKAKRARKTQDFVMSGNSIARMKFSAYPGKCTCQEGHCSWNTYYRISILKASEISLS